MHPSRPPHFPPPLSVHRSVRWKCLQCGVCWHISTNVTNVQCIRDKWSRSRDGRRTRKNKCTRTIHFDCITGCSTASPLPSVCRLPKLRPFIQEKTIQCCHVENSIKKSAGRSVFRTFENVSWISNEPGLDQLNYTQWTFLPMLSAMEIDRIVVRHQNCNILECELEDTITCCMHTRASSGDALTF